MPWGPSPNVQMFGGGGGGLPTEDMDQYLEFVLILHEWVPLVQIMVW